MTRLCTPMQAPSLVRLSADRSEPFLPPAKEQFEP